MIKSIDSILFISEEEGFSHDIQRKICGARDHYAELNKPRSRKTNITFLSDVKFRFVCVCVCVCVGVIEVEKRAMREEEVF